MADDAERAAKAARAKAMLKKRQQQQQKATSPSPSASPAPRSPEPHADASVLFGDAPGPTVDFGEFGVLKSPPPPTSPPPHNGAEAPHTLRTLVDNQQQTISLLVNEKASLTAQLDRLEGLESKSSENESRLAEERHHSEGLARRVRELEEQGKHSAARLEDATRRERDTNDKAREQDRELELARRSAGELHAQLETTARELRELQERVESDDRVETLERSLQGTQDRAEELAFQLAKTKQAHAAVVKERDATSDELKASAAREAEWQARFTALEDAAAAAAKEQGETHTALRTASETISALQAQLSARDTALAAARTDSASLAATTHALHVAQAGAADAARLQAENAGLLAQLEEVRPKVVALSNKAAEDEERIWTAEGRVRALEAQVREAGEERVRVEREGLAEVGRVRKELAEVQDGYAGLAGELEAAGKRAESLEEVVSALRTQQRDREEDSERWKAQAGDLRAELDARSAELTERRDAGEDTLSLLRRTQADVETLQDTLALREDELARLRDQPLHTDTDTDTDSHDLSAELLSAARQQHALDLSTAHSRIRALETALFDAQAQTHAAQKRAAALAEAEAVRVRTPTDSRRTSLSLSTAARPRTPTTAAPLLAPRPVYDANLSAATRHKRAVSLSMLRARIERERSPLARSVVMEEEDGESVRTPSPALSHVHSRKGGRKGEQFLDEAHVFWCHSCHGDLVVL